MRTYFVYCDEGLVGEYDASGTELRTYGWAPNSQWGTDPFFVKIGGQYYWHQNDHQGTPQKIITSSGQVVWSATYDSFGNAHIGVEATNNNLRFPGQYYDAETGFHYNLNRYYDPATGRYLPTDPYGQGLNLYAYCFSNPLSLIDPRGLFVVNTVGYYLGTSLGDESAMWYAERYNATGNPIYFIGGLFASLWTPDTYIQTAMTLATAPIVAAEIAAAGAQSAVAAARVAAKQIIEEVIGVPIPTKPKFASRSGGEIVEGASWDKIPITPKNTTALTGPFKGPYTKGIPAGTLDDISARKWYHQQLDVIPGKIDRTQSLRNQARQALELRNQARIDARALKSNRPKALAYDVTDPIRTWQEQIRYAVEVRGKRGSEIWEYILESSTRSRPSVDAAAGLAR